MGKGRMEAFSDGVFAIIITIMVLELKVPQGDSLATLKTLLPVFLTYVLSFIYVAIYWNNHHHMLHIVKKVNGKVLWANIHLLFWLSLFPFVTGWMGENHFATIPVALYGVVEAMAGIAYYILAHCLIDLHGKDSELSKIFGKDVKGIISIVFYLIAVAASFINTWISLTLYVVVAAIWFIPDKRIEKRINKEE